MLAIDKLTGTRHIFCLILLDEAGSNMGRVQKLSSEMGCIEKEDRQCQEEGEPPVPPWSSIPCFHLNDQKEEVLTFRLQYRTFCDGRCR